MAPENKEKKEKKRKAPTTDPTQKKTKKSKTSVGGTDSMSAQSGSIIAPETDSIDKKLSKYVARKRAADFLSDSENEAPTANGTVTVADSESAKSRKKKKSKKAVAVENTNGDVEQSSKVGTEQPLTVVETADSKVKKNKKLKGVNGITEEAASKVESPAVLAGAVSKGSKKKKGPDPAALIADKARYLLETPVSEWNKTKIKKTDPATSNAKPESGEQKNAAVLPAQNELLDPVRDIQSEEEDESEHDEDDQDVALLTGLDDDEPDTAEDVGLSPDTSMPGLSKKAKKKISKLEGKSDDAPGTVYIGHIPHGFYEHQMRAYFSQFGEITKLRLSRNRKTGASKHFAFVEFASKEVAKVAASSMDNYLMFGHILKCKFVPSENLHPDTWKGANRRYKATPWNKLEKKQLEQPKTAAQWDLKNAKEQKRRDDKKEKLKKLGYEFEAPKLKSAGEVIKDHTIEADEPQKTIEAPSTITNGEEAKLKKKKAKKDKKDKKDDAVEPQQPIEAPPVSGNDDIAKPKQKGRKGKTQGEAEPEKAIEVVSETPQADKDEVLKPKKKKSKKEKEAEVEPQQSSNAPPSSSDTITAPVPATLEMDLPTTLAKSVKSSSKVDHKDPTSPNAVNSTTPKTKKQAKYEKRQKNKAEAQAAMSVDPALIAANPQLAASLKEVTKKINTQKFKEQRKQERFQREKAMGMKPTGVKKSTKPSSRGD